MRIHTSQLREKALLLKAGDRILLSGVVYTSRDAAHKRIATALNSGQQPPFCLSDAVIYYSGATPAPKGMVIGSCGPTTSERMDLYAPELYDCGVVATIGKGDRNNEVIDAIRKNHALYLCALGGAGALAAKAVTSCEVIAYDDLGCESIKKLTIKDFPLIVGIDCNNGNIFDRSK